MSCALTSVHSSLQAQQQVRQASLAGSRQVGVQAAALLPQVQLASFRQGVTNSVVLGDELLSGCQGVATLRSRGDVQKIKLVCVVSRSSASGAVTVCSMHLF